MHTFRMKAMSAGLCLCVALCGLITSGCKEEPGQAESFYVINNSDEIAFVIYEEYCSVPTGPVGVENFFGASGIDKARTLYAGDSLRISLHTKGFNGLGAYDETTIYALKISTLNKYSKQEIIDNHITDAALHVTLTEACEKKVFPLF